MTSSRSTPVSPPSEPSMRLASLVLLLSAACATPGAPPPTDDAAPRAGPAKLGALELPRYPDNTPWRLAAERGNVIVLDVWATWCDPCRETLPLYQALQNEFGARGLRVYALNVDAQPAVIAPFLAESKLTLPVLLDPEATVAARTLKVSLMPTAYLFDRQGNLRRTHEGFDEAQFAGWLKEIEHLLSEPAQ